MGFGYKNFLAGIRLVPVSSTGVTLKGDLEALDSSGKLNYFNGTTASPVVTESHAATLTNKSISGSDNTITNISAASLNLTNSIVNSDINTAAGIVYSKLNLVNSIVNVDINAAAAISYSKLNLSNSIINTDINNSAAISRSKLASGNANGVAFNNGTGVLTDGTDLQFDGNFLITSKPIKFTNSGFFVALQSPALSGSTTYTLPATDGSANQFLKTNGSAVLSFASVSTNVAVSTKTGAYALTSADDVILANTAGGGFTLTIPAAGLNTGKIFKIIKIDSTFNVVTLGTGLSTTLNTQGEEVEIIDNGVSWTILNRKNNTEWLLYSLTIGASNSAPTKGGIVTDTAYWRRVGDSIEIKYDYFANSAGANGSGTYLFPMPTGLTIDSGKSIVVSNNQIGVVGFGGAFDSVTNRAVQVLIFDTTNVSLKTIGPNAPGSPDPTDISSTAFQLGNTSVKYSFYYKVPISGWKS